MTTTDDTSWAGIGWTPPPELATPVKNATGGSRRTNQDDIEPCRPAYESMTAEALRHAQLTITARARDVDEARYWLAGLGLIPDPYPPAPNRNKRWGRGSR